MSTGRLGAGDSAIQSTIVDAKGDLIVATAADTPARLAVGSANQVLTVDSSTSTGLKWATPATDTNGLVFITSSTFSGQASVTIDNCFTSTYTMYLITMDTMSAVTGGDDLQLQMRFGSSTKAGTAYFGSYVYQLTNSATFSGGGYGFRSAAQVTLSPDVGATSTNSGGHFYICNVGTGSSAKANMWGQYANNNTETAVHFGCTIDSAENYTGFLLKSSSSNISGTVRVYGLAKS